jgi:hypothetical protein
MFILPMARKYKANSVKNHSGDFRSDLPHWQQLAQNKQTRQAGGECVLAEAARRAQLDTAADSLAPPERGEGWVNVP